jgi:Domain of unknown function (DUF4349)
MSEASFETVLQELRDTAPVAPDHLRTRVRELPEPTPRRRFGRRSAISAIAATLVGVAIIGGLLTDSSGREPGLAAESLKVPQARLRALGGGTSTDSSGQRALAPMLTAKSRLQQQQVSMLLRVDDLSGATQTAVRQTRKLGGYVAAANYSTGEARGDSRLVLRVPAQNVQKAIARFTELGTILAQQIHVADLQAGLDRLEARIAAKQKLLGTLTGDRLEKEQRALRRLERSRIALVREGTYAKVSLRLTTSKPAAKEEEPGRFDQFWGDAGDILGKEAIAVLYALVIVGPFAILAALAFFAARARRRRADHRLLEETG